MNRRELIKSLSILSITGLVAPSITFGSKAPFFKISLAEWSLHRTLQSGKMTNLNFPIVAKQEFGISAVEYVNSFFKDKAQDASYLKELLSRCNGEGIKNLLIMCDGEGSLGDPDQSLRTKAVENHFRWLEAAAHLGCHSIRVNAAGKGSKEEISKTAADGLYKLSERAGQMKLNVIVENHGGYSSIGSWLSNVIAQVNLPNCGTLPDFGNFCVKWESNGCAEEYDRYLGVEELMPYAKAVSAKSYDFDANGNCIETDYLKMLQIIKKSDYTGYIGIEYEGSRLSEKEGIAATLNLLNNVGSQL
ncbi:MAG: TIM barrel protein [Flammeovirgaceae bacterium]|nr:TIM barrel protein [Flammeovirgaceae bacterium]